MEPVPRYKVLPEGQEGAETMRNALLPALGSMKPASMHREPRAK